jgi:ABC-type transport system involved in multi-copper enzyme maturation permease subunit
LKIMSSALSEYKIIVKSRIFYTFLFLTAVFIFMEGFYLYNTLLPETVNEQIEWYSQSLFSLSESVAMDREMIIDLLRPIHPFTSFLNPIYVFDILAIVIFVIVSSILMGVEFKNKTIKVKKSNFSTLHIFLSKILAVEYAYISYIIFAMTVNAVTSLVFWGRIKNEYGFFLDKFNLNFEFSHNR